jgi:hypothetical protein
MEFNRALNNKKLLLTRLSELDEFIAMLTANRDESLELMCGTPPAEISEDRHKMLRDMIRLSSQHLYVATKERDQVQNHLAEGEGEGGLRR